MRVFSWKMVNRQISVFFGLCVVVINASLPCISKEFGKDSFVCVCNSTYCDFEDAVVKIAKGKALLIVTDLNGKRFDKTILTFKTANSIMVSSEDTGNGSTDTESVVLVLDETTKKQNILGWGGAFTDSAGINIGALPDQAQAHLMRSYFEDGGLNYNLGRISIGGSDFSTHPYTYADEEGKNDSNKLEHWMLKKEDIEIKIPMVKLAMRLRGKKGLSLLASPWSAPAWMKTNNAITGRGFLLDQYYQLWAEYIDRFLRSYESQGIPIWAITPTNEPFNGNVPFFPFNCMGWSAESEMKWIMENMGPMLESRKPKIKLLMFDDNRISLLSWTRKILSNPNASRYIDGIAVHWYSDWYLYATNDLELVHKEFPSKYMIYTEACNGFRPWDMEKVMLGDWNRAENYFDNIVQDLNHWVTGWIDWNLALDLKGGPNWVHNYVDAPIIVDPIKSEFYKQPTFYALGQITRYVVPGSRILSLTKESGNTKISYISALRPDGGVVVIIHNSSKKNISLTVTQTRRGNLSEVVLGPKSFNTIVFW